jgi:hypothetical protein
LPRIDFICSAITRANDVEAALGALKAALARAEPDSFMFWLRRYVVVMEDVVVVVVVVVVDVVVVAVVAVIAVVWYDTLL